MGNGNFRGRLFGGFNRKDVTKYIEAEAAEHQCEVEELNTRLADAAKEADALKEDFTALSAERDQFVASSKDFQSKYDQLRTVLASTQEDRDSLRASMTAACDERDRLQAECAALQAKVDELNVLAEEYASVKAHIAEIELQARQRAAELEAEVNCKLIESVGECSTKCRAILSAVNTACSSASVQLTQATQAVDALPATLKDALSSLQALNDRLS